MRTVDLISFNRSPTHSRKPSSAGLHTTLSRKRQDSSTVSGGYPLLCIVGKVIPQPNYASPFSKSMAGKLGLGQDGFATKEQY